MAAIHTAAIRILRYRTSVTFLIFAGILLVLSLIYFVSAKRGRAGGAAAVLIFRVPPPLPLSARLSTEYLAREGVTVPSRNRGKTNMTIQAANAAQMRKLVLTVKIRSAFLYRDGRLVGRLPEFGVSGNIYDIFGKNFVGLSSVSGSGFLSALRPPYTFPSAMAIMMVPMMMVQTI